MGNRAVVPYQARCALTETCVHKPRYYVGLKPRTDLKQLPHGGNYLFQANVKEHATLSARTLADHGVRGVVTGDHENRAADRGCVSRLVRLLLWFNWLE